MSTVDPYDLDRMEEHADHQRASAQAESRREEADFKWLMSGPRGRRIVFRLLERAGVYRSSFHSNAMEMARQEGGKQLGYWLLEQIERFCPEGYHTMTQEMRSV